MTGKINPLKLQELNFRPRKDPAEDWIDSPGAIAEALGERRLGPANRLKLKAGWRYSEAAVGHFQHICRQYMRHSKGRWGGEPIEWTDWQLRDWIRPIFGWFRPDGLRGVRRAYIECGKKSGKSTFAASVALYMALFDGEGGPEVYCLASTKEQAQVVQGQIDQIVMASQELENRAHPWRLGTEIGFPQGQASIKAMSGYGMSGPNTHCLIMDELHEWKRAAGFERWVYSSRARENWLHLMITNAGDDTESICYRQRTYAQKVMRGEIDDPSYYGRIYSVSREQAEAEIESVGEGATALPVAMQCNPGLGSILRTDDFRSDIIRAIHVPSELPNLLRYGYCVWRTNAALDWIAHRWDDCQSDYTLEDLRGVPAWLGLDMSSVVDMTALVLVTREDRVYRIWPMIHVPRRRADELRKWTAVEAWEKSGAIEIHPGERINKDRITELILELYDSHDIQGLVYDPKESMTIVNDCLEQVALDCIPFKQSHENYHEGTDNFEADVKEGYVMHPGNPVFSWQAKHAICVATTHGYKKPLKPDPSGAPHKGVDAIQAAVMAYSQALHHEDYAGDGRTYDLA